MSPSFSAQALREWRLAEVLSTLRPFVRVRDVCATRSIRCIVFGPCVCACIVLRLVVALLIAWAVIGVDGGPG